MAEREDDIRRDPVESAARACLRQELLIERAERIAATAAWIAGFEELASTACDRNAVRTAVWFQDAWCRDGASGPADIGWRVLSKAPGEIERRRSAGLLADALRGRISSAAIDSASRALCEAGYRETRMPEAWVVSEATSLEAFGPLWLWAEVSRCTAEARPMASLVAVWERQVEYGYWKRRINDAFRFPRSQKLATRRCEVLESFFVALRQQLDGSDRRAISG